MTRRAVRTPRSLGALPPVRRSSPGRPLRARALSLSTILCTALLLATGCAPSRPAPAPAPEPAPVSAPIPLPEKPVPVDPLAEPWVVGAPTAPVTQELVVTTVVRAAASAATLATAHSDSSRTALTVRWDGTEDMTRRSGAITAYRVGPAALASATTVPAGLTLPVALSAALDAGRGAVHVTSPDDARCAADAAAAQLAREVLVAPPSPLARGLTWADSLRTTVCRDSIPLALTSIRRYVVEDARVQEGRAVVVIRRRSSITLSGAGTQFGEAVTITGEGTGELLFGLRLDDGQMTDGNGISTLTLTLVGRRKSQVVTQGARLEIRR